MRIFLCFIVFIWAGLSGCVVDGESYTPPPQPRPTGIVGNWVWYKTGGFGFIHTPQNTNQQFSLVLKSDSSFSRAGDYSFITSILPDSTGTFQLLPVIGCGGPPGTPGIKFSSINYPNGRFFPKFRIYSGDTLVLDGGSACDLPVYYFVRN